MVKKSIVLVFSIIAIISVAIFSVGCKDKADVSVVSISITEPTKTEYFVGEEFDSSGMIVTARFSDKTKRRLSADEYVISVPNMNTAGIKVVVVTYQGVSEQFNIKIVSKSVAGLSFKGSLINKTQFLGEKFNPQGLQFEVLFTDNSSEQVNVSSIKFTSDGIDEFGKLSKLGTIEITAAYLGKKASATINLNVVAHEANKHIVSFNKNIDYFVEDMPADAIISDGNKVEGVAVPSLLGFDFEGWYKESDCINKWNLEEDLVTENLTLYANWLAKSYNVNYYLDDGTNGNNPNVYTATNKEFVDISLLDASKKIL